MQFSGGCIVGRAGFGGVAWSALSYSAAAAHTSFVHISSVPGFASEIQWSSPPLRYILLLMMMSIVSSRLYLGRSVVAVGDTGCSSMGSMLPPVSQLNTVPYASCQIGMRAGLGAMLGHIFTC